MTRRFFFHSIETYNIKGTTLDFVWYSVLTFSRFSPLALPKKHVIDSYSKFRTHFVVNNKIDTGVSQR